MYSECQKKLCLLSSKEVVMYNNNWIANNFNGSIRIRDSFRQMQKERS